MSALVRIEADRVVADSRDVAADFGKQHKHVLRSIDEMVKVQPDLEPNFGPKVYSVATGDGGTRHARCFDLDRKGFMLLVMGFNGAKALEIKSRWIDAFDAMEHQLLVRHAADNDDADGEAEALPDLPADFRDRMRFVSEARLLGGKEAGRRAWRVMALPDVFIPEVLGVSGGSLLTTPRLSEAAAASGVVEWARERLRPSEGSRDRLGIFYADFDDWHRTAHGGGAPVSIVTFGKALKRMGLRTYRSNGSYLAGFALAS